MKSTRGPKVGSFWWLVTTPASRTYLVVGIASLLIHYLIMSTRGGELGSLLLLAVAVPGLTVGWVVSPGLFVLLSTYLFIDPNFQGLVSGYSIRLSSSFRGPNTPLFNIEDILLATSALAYLISHFRLQTLAFRGMPEEPRINRKGEREGEIVRPDGLVDDTEMGVVLVLTISGMILGQFIWWLLTTVERRTTMSNQIGVYLVFGRLMLFVFVVVGITFLSTFVFSYIRWLRMSKLEARLILQDEVWSETRREHERILHWRKWHLRKTPEDQQENLR